jgi:hypothetical protein
MRLRARAPHVIGMVALTALFACDDAPSRRGRACTSDADCATLRCVAHGQAAPEDLAALPLDCGEPRDAAAPGHACEQPDDCALGVCVLAGACARPCQQHAQCGAGQRCADVYARTSSAALQTLRACVNTIDLPDDAEVSVELQRAALRGRPDQLDAIDLPGLDAPSLLVLEHLGEDPWPLSQSNCRPALCARRLVTRDADPVVLYDRATLDGAPDGPKNPIANGNHVNPVTLLIPNGPRGELSANGYEVSLQSEAAGDLRITRLQRTARGQRLDLNLFYVGAAELAPADARGPAFIRDALDELDRIFAQADIFVGEVRQIEVTGELLERGATLPGVTIATGFSTLKAQYGVCPQLPELWKLSAGAANVALNVFLVADVERCGTDGDIGGLAGGTPGPLGMHGTAGSGVVISTDMMLADGDPRRLGRTIAHELGHLMGLFHTTELDGIVIDPLPDTDSCAPTRADDGCTGNLMFPTTDATSTTLTEDQREVLRSAIVLQ